MAAARAAFLFWRAAAAAFASTISAEPLSSAFAEATADDPPTATGESGRRPRPVARRQPGQPPSGASAGISAPHFGQSLSALVIIGESLALSPVLLRKILSEVTPVPQQLDGAAHLQCRWASQPYGRSLRAITFGNADEIGKTLV